MDWSVVRSKFKNCTLETFENVFKDMDNIYASKPGTEMKTLERDNLGFPSLMYAKIKMPMFITNRDLVMTLVRKQLEPKKVLYLMQSVDRDDIPVPASTIRMNIF
jgi:hypothetical protein